jgi:mannose-6-phosphate isomerase-like protein (cupin superfamily)
MNASEEEAQSNKAASSVPLSVGREEIDVGLRLREVRKARRRTLRDVAEATEITAVLRRIAVTLGVSLGDLFQEDSGQGLRVLSVANWPALSFGILGRKYHLHAAPDRQFDLLICDFEPGGSTGEEPYSHGDSEELVLVLEGSASLEVGTEVVALECNDSTVYRSSVPHRLTADPQTGARVLFVETPPSF